VTTCTEKSYDKEQSLGKTELQFSKASERNSKAKEERGKKAAQTGKKHREARRGTSSASTSGRGSDEIATMVDAGTATFRPKWPGTIETNERKKEVMTHGTITAGCKKRSEETEEQKEITP